MHLFAVILTITIIPIWPNSSKWVVFVKAMHFVSCEVRTETLNVIYTHFRLQTETGPL